jgi:hypothetical protein
MLDIEASIGFKPAGKVCACEGGRTNIEQVEIARQSDGIHDEHEALCHGFVFRRGHCQFHGSLIIGDAHTRMVAAISEQAFKGCPGDRAG